MKKIILLLVFLLSFSFITAQKSKDNELTKRIISGHQYFDKTKYNELRGRTPGTGIEYTPLNVQDSVTLMAEDFEGAFPSAGWSVFAEEGFTDASWGVELVSETNHAAWCASSGTQASAYGSGYANDMKTWMIYGPFDLSDAVDAKLEFWYYNSCEPDFDQFWWLASEDGSSFNGFFLSDTSLTSGFTFKVFDLTNVPTIGNLAGKPNIFVAFLFKSDSTVSNYWGSIVDQIVLKKYSGGINYPSTITLNKSFIFGDPAQQTSYRMIGLPGITNIPMASLINGTPKQDWTAFYDNGADANFLTAFDGQALFNFNPGKGFWVLSKNPVNISRPNVTTVALVGGNVFNIPLHSGWNIISNPFERSVNWIDVQNINGITQPIHDFNGAAGYSQPPNMETYKGYYFFNADNRGTLSLPYNPAGTLGKSFFKTNNSADLKISISLENSEKSSSIISINSESKDDYDINDIFAPPGNFEEVKVSIYNELLPSYKYLMVDSRNEIGEGQSYNIEVKNSSGKSCFLQIEEIENFPDNEIYLLNLLSKKSCNLKIQSKVEINSLHENNEFRLLIGSNDYVDKRRFAELPSEFKLYKNYPNPFNPSTVISFDLPRNENVNLLIYNILGEKIKTLYSGILEAGRYEFTWNGKNDLNAALPSGVYIYSLEGVNFKSAEKMILNR